MHVDVETRAFACLLWRRTRECLSVAAASTRWPVGGIGAHAVVRRPGPRLRIDRIELMAIRTASFPIHPHGIGQVCGAHLIGRRRGRGRSTRALATANQQRRRGCCQANGATLRPDARLRGLFTPFAKCAHPCPTDRHADKVGEGGRGFNGPRRYNSVTRVSLRSTSKHSERRRPWRLLGKRRLTGRRSRRMHCGRSSKSHPSTTGGSSVPTSTWLLSCPPLRTLR